jgi:hypothetical protein
MNELLSSDIWNRVQHLAKTAQKKSAAIAYVTDDSRIRFGANDTLITDASDPAIKSGQTSATVLQAAVKRGARVFSLPGLHAKVCILDQYAIIGSANLSKASDRLTEVALLTDQPSVVSASRLLIEQISENGEPVDADFLNRISTLPVQDRSHGTRGNRARIPTAPMPRTWLLGLMPVAERSAEARISNRGREEAQRSLSSKESTVAPIRYRGNSRFRKEAKRGDLVIRIWTPQSNGRPQAVYHHSPILQVTQDLDNDVTWFYVEEYPDADETSLKWKHFLKICAQLEHPRNVSQWAAREIPGHISDAMHNLWLGGRRFQR